MSVGVAGFVKNGVVVPNAPLPEGDSRINAFAFIEFEDAAPGSIFVKKKPTPDWSNRFEYGFSQLVDWFFKLSDQGATVEFEDKFGDRTIYKLGILVVGRTEHLGKREQQRLRWRQENVLLASKPIHCKTFDQLRDDVLDRLDQFTTAAKAETAAAAAQGKDKTRVKKTPDKKRGK
jgi:hypothetical protein